MPQHKCQTVGSSLTTRCYVCTEWQLLPLPSSLYTHYLLLCCGSSMRMYYSQLLRVTSSAHTPARYAEWRPGEIYTDFHLLAKKPRNYRVVNTSVIMGAENLYFWLLTFVKSFKNGFYSAKLLGKQPTDLCHLQ